MNETKKILRKELAEDALENIAGGNDMNIVHCAWCEFTSTNYNEVINHQKAEHGK